MSEEEKQAVKDFEDLLKKHFEETSVTSFNFLDGIEGIHILNIIEKQQKEIERLKEEGIGDTKFDKLLFSIRMLHFHNYVNDKQFAEMIKKLSNENKGE